MVDAPPEEHSESEQSELDEWDLLTWSPEEIEAYCAPNGEGDHPDICDSYIVLEEAIEGIILIIIFLICGGCCFAIAGCICCKRKKQNAAKKIVELKKKSSSSDSDKKKKHKDHNKNDHSNQTVMETNTSYIANDSQMMMQG